MAIMVRRLTIIVLLMAIFAMSFATLVIHPQRSFQRVHLGTATACFHPATPACIVVL
jgi:hypothetical protein